MSFKDKFFQKSPLTSHGGTHTDPTDNYKKWLESKEKQKAEIDSLKNVVSSQKEEQISYDKQMQDYKSMIKKIKDFSSSERNLLYGGNSNVPEEQWNTKYDFSKDVKRLKINPYGKSEFPTHVYFKDKDKKQIGISYGAYAANDEDIFVTDYFPKPKGQRPETSETSNILQEKLKAFEEQEKAGFKTAPKQSVIKDYEVYSGPRYNPDTGKVERYTTTSQYRTKE